MNLSALPSLPCLPSCAASLSSQQFHQPPTAGHQRTDTTAPTMAPQRRQPFDVQCHRNHADDDGSATPPPKFCNQTATTLPLSSAVLVCSIIVGCCISTPEPVQRLDYQNHHGKITPATNHAAPKLTGRGGSSSMITSHPRRIIVPIQQAMDQRFEVADLRLQHQNVFLGIR